MYMTANFGRFPAKNTTKIPYINCIDRVLANPTPDPNTFSFLMQWKRFTVLSHGVSVVDVGRSNTACVIKFSSHLLPGKGQSHKPISRTVWSKVPPRKS